MQKYGLFLCCYLMFVSGAVVWFACTHLVLGSTRETERDRDAFRAEGKTGGVWEGETQTQQWCLGTAERGDCTSHALT